MLIEIHMLQNHSPANLNRDDLGAPKTALFGGTLRARISSQCIKRSIRRSVHFQEALQGFVGTRTVSFPELVRNALKDSNIIPPDEHDKIIVACTRIAKAEKNQKIEDATEDDAGARTPQLIFLCPNEAVEFVTRLGKLRLEMPADYKLFLKVQETSAAPDSSSLGKKKDGKVSPSKKFWQELRQSYGHNGVDVALFGRMTTSNAFENVEAAMEVAHAISTNEIVPEVDWFTATDDLAGRAGAAFIDPNGGTQFNSATFYKYFSLDWDALKKELRNVKLAAQGLEAFVFAAVHTVPTGKRKGFGNSNLPDGILVEIKDKNIATNYANAFLLPARSHSDNAGSHDIMAVSIRMLDHYAKSLISRYGIESQGRWFTTRPEVPFGAMPQVGQLSEMVKWMLDTVRTKEGDHANP